MSTTHVVGMSDCKVSADPTDTVVTYALGSCVGVSLYDPRARVGGLLHIMLPESSYRSPKREFNPHMYADSGCDALVRAVLGLGARKDRLEVRLAGGANMLHASSLLDIGKRNAEAVVTFLARERIPIRGESLRGTVGRSMSLRVSDGQVTVRLLGRGEEKI